MGGITSLAGAALPFITLSQQINQEKADRKRQAQSDMLAQQQLLDSQTVQEQQAVKDTALQKQQLDLAQSADDAARQQALREKQAATRARLGSMGVLSAGGSGDAVLRNLLEQSTQDEAVSSAAYQLKQKALSDDLSAMQQRNLLKRAQLVDEQRLRALYR